MIKNAMEWFVVKKGNRIVDCVKAKTIGMALQAALDVWEKDCERSGELLEVEVMPPKPERVVQVATRKEVKQYGYGGEDCTCDQCANPVYAALMMGAK